MSGQAADWCVSDGALTICGTRMVEHSRSSEGIKWCFGCRKRAEFHYIVSVPDGPSYYEPSGAVKCSQCGLIDGDLFPGWSREWDSP